MMTLRFDDRFEGGNIGRVEQISEQEYDVKLRPDSCSPRQCLWFYFRVSGHHVGQTAVINIVNFSRSRSLFRQGMTPVVRRSGEQQAWHRMLPRCVYYHASPAHGGANILSILFTFPAAGGSYEFAYTIPFMYMELQVSLSLLERLRAPWLVRGLLTRTPQGRRVDVLVIADHASLGSPAKAERPGSGAAAATGATVAASASARMRPVVVLTGRVHPGEAPGSHVLQGLLHFLCSAEPAAALLRRSVTWVICPMMNPDGVCAGNYRTDAAGSDLNRRWATATAEAEPSITAALGLLHHYAHDAPGQQLAIFIDVHAHSASSCSFLFCNHPSGEAAAATAGVAARHAAADTATGAGADTGTAAGDQAPVGDVMRLPRLLGQLMPGFSTAACVFDSSPAKAGCARRVVGAAFPEALCYTLEVSMFHASEGAAAGPHATGPPAASLVTTSTLNTVGGYHCMGKSLAEAFIALFGLKPPQSGAPAPHSMASRAGDAHAPCASGGSDKAPGGCMEGDAGRSVQDAALSSRGVRPSSRPSSRPPSSVAMATCEIGASLPMHVGSQWPLKRGEPAEGPGDCSMRRRQPQASSAPEGKADQKAAASMRVGSSRPCARLQPAVPQLRLQPQQARKQGTEQTQPAVAACPTPPALSASSTPRSWHPVAEVQLRLRPLLRPSKARAPCEAPQQVAPVQLPAQAAWLDAAPAALGAADVAVAPSCRRVFTKQRVPQLWSPEAGTRGTGAAPAAPAATAPTAAAAGQLWRASPPGWPASSLTHNPRHHSRS